MGRSVRTLLTVIFGLVVGLHCGGGGGQATPPQDSFDKGPGEVPGDLVPEVQDQGKDSSPQPGGDVETHEEVSGEVHDGSSEDHETSEPDTICCDDSFVDNAEVAPGECVPEGESVPVVPNAPECCPGLVKVPCDTQNEAGECMPCVGASICTKCGDGECGKGENICNCPSDCKVPAGCLGLGEKFMDFNTQDKCCPGLNPVPDCIAGSQGGCACPECPCYICLPCGDGVCGPYENECNCPIDCATKCVPEGESVPVVPNAPECCPGLVKVPCDSPNEEGECMPCVGASICTKCGDGECGKGENICNCPSDCGQSCLGLGETFIDFKPEGKCCPGLKPKPDCEIWTEPQCTCPKCPCYICLECGDGLCGPFEHFCNCPEDCPTPEKCVPTKKSECLGDPYGSDPSGTLKVKVDGHDITLVHEKVVLNCCLETTVCFIPKHNAIEVIEHKSGTPCFCQCLFTIEAVLQGFKSGTYDLTLYNEEQDQVLFKESVVVP